MEESFSFVPNTDFAIETDGARMKRRACIFDHIFRIDGFASTVPFHDFRAVRIQGLRECVDRVFICVLSRDQVHRAYVHARERFGLSFVGIGRDRYRIKERIVSKEGLFRCVVKWDEEDVLRGTGLCGSGCWDRTTDECRGGGTVG